MVGPPANSAPFVLIPADNRQLGDHPYHVLGKKYSDAVRDAAGCLPIIVATAGLVAIDPYLELAAGVLLTGSPSNVHPSHFGQTVLDPALPLDPARDAVTLPLIRKLIARRLPLLAICRGLQEINVALGGTLHQAVHAVAGRHDHRGRPGSVEEEYGPAHEIEIVEGGLLARILGERRLTVNSVHGQGIDRIAPGLAVEAIAPDGTIEAVRLADHPGFALALQWHPEWRVRQSPPSLLLFEAFGAACREAATRAN
jgi:putative glutamine amidotransferase